MTRRSNVKRSSLGSLPSVFIDGQTILDMVLSCKPENISGSYAFKWHYLSTEILSKYVGVDTDPAELRHDRAIAKLLESEKSCRDINERGFRDSPLLNGSLYAAQVKIAEILGEIPRDLFEDSRFTSGASTGHKRAQGNPYYKYNTSKPVDVTPRLRPYAEALITSTPLWCAYGGYFGLRSVLGNKVTTVPKKSDIDRAIAMEPCMNQHMQTALGDHIRGRLKVFGIDLNDQTRNQRLARHGSRTGLVSTIDLSAASDSISIRLVQELLPPDWYELFCLTRSPRGILPDGSVIKWEKFSSMGNGFTFELESMIFYALMVGTYNARCGYVSYDLPSFNSYWKKHVSVYGDDIICPSFLSNDLIEILSCVGFKTNSDKTFIDGTFRESCGRHYFAGVDVSPFYVRKPIDNTNRVIWFLNKLRLWSFDESQGMCDPSIHTLWLTIRRKYVPERFLGGKEIGDDSCVYSAEMPRKRLVNDVSRRRIGGYRAFLSRAQNWGRSLDEHVLAMRYSSNNSYISSSGSATVLCKVIEHKWVEKNNIILDSRMLWSSPDYLFPKEIR